MTVGRSHLDSGPRVRRESDTVQPGPSGAAEDATQVLSLDGERVFCRRRIVGEDGSPRSALVVTPAAARPAPLSLDRLAHEYALKDELDPAWAARPLALAREHERTVLSLEDPGGEPLDTLLGDPMEVRSFLRLAVGMAFALGEVHKRGLVHKDVKPAHILVHRATGQAWFTGFGIASRLPRERRTPDASGLIAGTLAYMAPEQTGRMNRSVDARSDLYSLGVTFYQMLTGSLPFAAAEPIEWVHCHVARMPVPPAERSQGVPVAISAIVMKLLAKNAEERYQTAAGVERDLRGCLAQWEAQGRVDAFPLAERDTPDRLLIPEKLYGRARETEALLASFDRVVGGGAPEFVLLSGYSGIGKSSIVHELHKVLVPSRGLFAAGKCDRYERDVPYSTLAQAFRSLAHQLLGKSDAELGHWRAALHAALGRNARLVVDLVPDLKIIVGDQPPVPELPPREAQRRFRLAMRQFLGVFAGPEHPLAVFLDDLQWLDAATLELLEDLFAAPELRHLLVIGAYRDHEVEAAHPLLRTVEAIRRAGAVVHPIKLVPLGSEDVECLLADAFRCAPERARPLAQLVYEKTQGNPFFAIQFVTALCEEGLIAFDHDATRWAWDLERIHAQGYTENVVDLMVEKLKRLPAVTFRAVQQLACVGNAADTATLAIVRGTSVDEIHSDLSTAVRLELVERIADAYRFVHDRVREAAYSLIPESSRAETHLRIGRLLGAHTPPERREERVFEIVNQLNRAAALITARDEREQLAELNLLAGKRARASSAHASALTYFAAGTDLLGEDCWGRRYDLVSSLELHRAECEFLTADAPAAERRLNLLARRAADLRDLAAVTCLRIDLSMTLDSSDRGVEVGLEFLRSVGIGWSPHPSKEDMRGQFQRMWELLGSRPIRELVDLPVMDDPGSHAKMDVLAKLLPPALFTDEALLGLVVAHMANMSLEHGNTDGSCLAYVWLGLLLAQHFGEHRAASEFGQLGIDLLERRGLDQFRARVYLDFAHVVNPWVKHVRCGPALVRRAFDAANEIGDLTFAGYSSCNLVSALLATGDPLADVQREAEEGLRFARSARFGLIVDIITGQLRLVLALRGLTPGFSSFSGGDFDELRFEHHLDEGPGTAVAVGWYWVRKLQGRLLAGDLAGALAAAAKVERFLWTIPSHLELAEYHFYAAMARAGAFDAASPDERHRLLEALEAHHRQLAHWARHCPENFEGRAALVAAEIARIGRRELQAERLYEEAIGRARENGLIHDEAIAHESAARFYATRGFETISRAYLRNARHCYVRWGADGKVRQLEQSHPQLEDEPPVTGATGTIEAPVEHLDLATVIKVSEAISGEIVRERLTDTVMRLAIEHAGADRGLLILARGDEQRIEAEAVTTGDAVTVHSRDEAVVPGAVPDSLVHYVVRTREPVVLDDTSALGPFSADAYFRQCRARSVLCLPLVTQGKLIGVLYLENSLAPHVFTPGRSAVLKLLATRAAISLENTRLYRELEAREARNRELQVEMARANRVAVLGELTASIAHEIKQPIAAMMTNAHAALRWLHALRPDPEEASQALEHIVRDCNRAREVIDGVRRLVGKTSPRMIALRMNDAISEILGVAAGELAKHGVTLRSSLADGLPLVRGDRVQLQQVVLNLVLNAVEAMSDTTDGARELLVSTEARDPGVLVAVRDTGPGMGPAALERMGEAFYTTKPDGLGLGLSICRSIVEAHGGRLWGAANAPRGAVIQFTIPAHREGTT